VLWPGRRLRRTGGVVIRDLRRGEHAGLDGSLVEGPGAAGSGLRERAIRVEVELPCVERNQNPIEKDPAIWRAAWP